MKLRTKFLMSMALATTLLTAAAMVIVQRSVDVHARQEIFASFEKTSRSLRDFQERREAAIRHSAGLLSETPPLKNMMSTDDYVTVQDASGKYWPNAGADLMVIYDASGKLLAIHNTGSAISSQALSQAAPVDADSHWWLIGNRLFEIVWQPVEAGNFGERTQLGAIVLGQEIDASVVHQIISIADAEVAFRYRKHIVASSLKVEQRQELEAKELSESTQDLTLAGESFQADVLPAGPQNDTAEIIILKSYDQATLFVRQMNRLILTVGAIVILLGTVVVFLISHTFTQPLSDLVEGVRALGSGDFSYPLHTKGKDEIAELTSSFDGMRQSLQKSQESLVTSARMEAVGQLAGGVAHDFNNLITVIKGYAELLTMQIKPDDPAMKFADQISKAGDRASSLTRQLLAFSRKQAVEPQAVDLNLLITNLQKMLRVLVGERYEVSFQPGTKLGRVFADPGQLEQVVLNLVVNARDAMPDGGKIEIRTDNIEVDQDAAALHGASLGNYVRIMVADHGCGMSDEVQQKIFQPFFTTKDVGKGTGLGLSIVNNAVKQSGGFIHVASQLGEGSTFHIAIPQLESDAVEAPAVKTAPQVVRGSATILVVEDEDGVRNMIGDSLLSRGYKVLIAHNGQEALKILQSHHGTIDLIIADVVMPKLGGLDLANQLKNSSSHPKVLLMSGYADRIIELEDSHFALLRKPFTADTMVSSIEELLSESPKIAQLTSL